MDRQLLTRIGKVPAGERLPLSAFARELDATVSVIMTAVQSLVEAGKLDRDTLRPPIADVAPLPKADSSGQMLFDRIKAEAERRGTTVSGASVAIWGQNSSIFMLRKSPRPRAATIAKVEAWLESSSGEADADRAGAVPAPATPAPSGAGNLHPMQNAPRSGVAKVGGGDARSDAAAPAERPTGEELHAMLVAEAGRRRISLHKLALGLWPEPNWKLEQLRIAKRPTWHTVNRVRALIAGDPVPPGRGATTSPEMRLPRGERAALGMAPSARMRSEERSLAAIAEKRERVEVLREATDAAHAERHPGESLAEAVKREAEEISARRGAARKCGGRSLANLESAKGETLADRIRRCGREVEAEEADTTTGLARKRDFPAIPADRWTKLAALAGELGKRRSEVLIDVIDAGILCVTEDLREGER